MSSMCLGVLLNIIMLYFLNDFVSVKKKRALDLYVIEPIKIWFLLA